MFNVFITCTLWNLSRRFVNRKVLHDVVDILNGRSGPEHKVHILAKLMNKESAAYCYWKAGRER